MAPASTLTSSATPSSTASVTPAGFHSGSIPTTDTQSDQSAATNKTSTNLPLNDKTSKQASATASKQESSSESDAKKSSKADNLAVDDLEEQMASNLQLGMDAFLNQLNDSPETQQQFEKMLADFAGQLNIDDLAAVAAAADSSSSPTSATSKNASNNSASNSTSTASAPGTSSTKPSLQDTINKTMNRLNESKQEIDESVQNEADDGFLSNILKELESTMGDVGGGEGGQDMDLGNMINELLDHMAAKEVLYEPMKEMNEKYPIWIKDNSSKITDEERERYLNQHKIIKEIVIKFESPDYSDDNEEHKKYITARMELMQNSGAPPADLMTGMNPGISGFGADFDPSQMPEMPDIEGMPDVGDCQTQ